MSPCLRARFSLPRSHNHSNVFFFCYNLRKIHRKVFSKNNTEATAKTFDDRTTKVDDAISREMRFRPQSTASHRQSTPYGPGPAEQKESRAPIENNKSAGGQRRPRLRAPRSQLSAPSFLGLPISVRGSHVRLGTTSINPGNKRSPRQKTRAENKTETKPKK